MVSFFISWFFCIFLHSLSVYLVKSLTRMGRRNNQAPKRGKEEFFMISTAKKSFLLLVLTAIVVSGIFAQAPTLDKLTFANDITNSARAIVSAANKQISGAVVIPDTAPNGKPVYQIYQGRFRDCPGITSVTIPASMNNIDAFAFYGCTSLTSVTFLSAGVVINTAFEGDMATKYRAGGAGTYTRPAGSNTWTKQTGGTTVCPTCGGTGVVHL